MNKPISVWQFIRDCGFALFLILIASCSALAASAPQLTLDQAVQMALSYDIQVATARNNVVKNKLAVQQAVLKNYPQATVEDAQAHKFDKNSDSNMLTLSIKETYPTNFNIYGSKVLSDVEAAFWDQSAGEAAQKIAEANVRYNTVSLYVAVLKAGKTLAYQEKVLQNAKTALTQAQTQLKLAKITRPQELQAENDLANATYNLTKSRSDYELALRQLGNQIGVAAPLALQLQELNPPAQMNGDFSKLKDTALPKRMELRQAEIDIRKAERSLAQSQNQTLPQVNLSYNKSDGNTGGSLGYDFLSGAVSGTLEGRVNSDSALRRTTSTDTLLDTSRNNIILTFTWNLDFGTAQNQAKQDQLGVVNARKSLELASQNAAWEIDQAVANYRLAIDKVTNNQQLLPYYQKQVDLKKIALQLKLATQQDVNSAAQDLQQANLQVDLANYDFLLADYKLKQVSGELY